jgi:hypothetical protein
VCGAHSIVAASVSDCLFYVSCWKCFGIFVRCFFCLRNGGEVFGEGGADSRRVSVDGPARCADIMELS